jgi:GNAT superfamily N-acetyltransferase
MIFGVSLKPIKMSLMNRIVIREMQESDCAAVSRVQCASFARGAELEGFTSQQIADYFRIRGSEEAIRAQCEDDECLVACADDCVVGVVGINRNLITKLYVSPSYVGRGCGAALFKAAEQRVAVAGYRELRLVTIFPGTLRFYRIMGMREESRKLVEHGPMKGMDSILLTKRLPVE